MQFKKRWLIACPRRPRSGQLSTLRPQPGSAIRVSDTYLPTALWDIVSAGPKSLQVGLPCAYKRNVFRIRRIVILWLRCRLVLQKISRPRSCQKVTCGPPHRPLLYGCTPKCHWFPLQAWRISRFRLQLGHAGAGVLGSASAWQKQNGASAVNAGLHPRSDAGNVAFLV